MKKIWYPTAKRTMDIIFSTIGILLLSPLFIVIIILIKLTSKGPAIYCQVRLGQKKRPFNLYKFRTMHITEKEGPRFTTFDDPRITKIGHFLRKLKLDELPQLINVLKGDMSFVGPRPELPEFAEHFPEIFDKILQIRPGITDPASIKFRDESLLIESGNNIEKIYLEKILPQKLQYNLEYLETQSLLYDISLILKTMQAIFFKKSKSLL